MTHKMPKDYKLHPMFEPERFPAAELRFGLASVAIFASGKINLKGPCNIDYMVDILLRLLPVICVYQVDADDEDDGLEDGDRLEDATDYREEVGFFPEPELDL